MVILILQYNCRCGYESIMMALKILLTIKARIVILQKLFINNQKHFHDTFKFYWLKSEKLEIKVMMIIKHNLIDKFVEENITNLVNHPYFLWKFES